jgi:myosin heavy subunit
VSRYDAILPKDVLDHVSGDKGSTCEAIMETAQFSPEIWRIGKTKVFMKESDMVSHKTMYYHS